MVKVEKRDGRIVDYNKEKVREAVLNTFKDVDKEESEYARNKASEIVSFITKQDVEMMSVEEIQDIIEKKLMDSNRKDVARAFTIYRNNRSRIREQKTKLMQAVSEKLAASNVQNQNANIDEKSFGGRIGEASSEVLKHDALYNRMSEMARNNHLNNEIYIHDLNSYSVGMHNCLSIPFDKLLSNGFNTRQTDVRPANSVNTAFQLVAVIFQLQSLQQFGGVSATHLDWTMIPYVRKSFRKHFVDGCRYIENVAGEIFFSSSAEDQSIEDNEYKAYEKAYNYAIDMTTKEVYQGAEGLFHNLNTLQSRSGNQLPFTSINFGTCTLPEGRLIIRAILETSIKGIGKLHKTSIFPCSIFQCMKGVNRKPGDPNYDLFRLALQSTAQRLYPNYANVDWSVQKSWEEYDIKTRQEVINSLKDDEREKLIAIIREDNSVGEILGLSLVED